MTLCDDFKLVEVAGSDAPLVGTDEVTSEGECAEVLASIWLSRSPTTTSTTSVTINFKRKVGRTALDPRFDGLVISVSTLVVS